VRKYVADLVQCSVAAVNPLHNQHREIEHVEPQLIKLELAHGAIQVHDSLRRFLVPGPEWCGLVSTSRSSA